MSDNVAVGPRTLAGRRTGVNQMMETVMADLRQYREHIADLRRELSAALELSINEAAPGEAREVEGATRPG